MEEEEEEGAQSNRRREREKKHGLIWGAKFDGSVAGWTWGWRFDFLFVHDLKASLTGEIGT